MGLLSSPRFDPAGPLLSVATPWAFTLSPVPVGD